MAKREQPDISAKDASPHAPIPEEIQIVVDSDDGDGNDGAFVTPTPPAGIPARTERSGGISIGGGDFATPTPGPRTKRTTQPRGIPVVTDEPAAPADDIPVVEAPMAPAFPAAQPIAAVHDIASSADEFSAAPITPPPVVMEISAPAHEDFLLPTPLPTPLPAQAPLGLTPRPLGLTPTPLGLTPTPVFDLTPLPPTPVPEATPPPMLTMPSPVVSDARTPTPRPVTPSPLLVAPAAPAAATTPPPQPVTPPPQALTPPPVPVAATAPVVAPALPPESSGAIPMRPMPEADSGGNITPLASTLAHMAEAARMADGPAPPDSSESADDDVELVDAPAAAPAAPPVPRKTPPPPPPVTASPPPIPGGRTKLSPELLSALPVPEALSQRPRRPKRSKPWFEEVFDEDYMRTLPFVSGQQTARECSFIENSLEAPPGAELLDVGCGYGRHAIELTNRGFKVTGLDLSLPLLIRAADDAQRRAVTPNFVHADMREMAFEKQFDAAYCMLTSFGYFDEDANLRVAEGIARSLKPGGRFLLDVVNRDYIVGDLPTRIWWEGSGCVVLEEVDFNFHTSRLTSRRSVVFDDGRQLEQEISIRAYGLHELGRLLRQAGFRVLDISGSFSTKGQFFGSASRNLLILSEKRTDDR